MKWMGLTGGIASGKSTVSRLLQSRGLPVVDADDLARNVVALGSEGLAKVVERFGAQVLAPDQSLDRKKLGQIVFADRSLLVELENILHPLVRQQTLDQKARLQRQKHPLAFYDVPLLYEKAMQKDFDGVVVVSCPPEQQLRRLMARDNLSEVEARLRISHQLPLAEKVRSADFVIDNGGGLEELAKRVDEILRELNF
jgi:dephospho-CoA kinase